MSGGGCVLGTHECGYDGAWCRARLLLAPPPHLLIIAPFFLPPHLICDNRSTGLQLGEMHFYAGVRHSGGIFQYGWESLINTWNNW